MNFEAHRTFVIKLCVISAGAGLLSFAVLRPNTLHAGDMQLRVANQTQRVQEGDQQIKEHADQVQVAIANMEQVRARFLNELVVEDATRSYQYLQRTALAHGLTVTRIEPMRTGSESLNSTDPLDQASITTREFRIECDGPLSGLLEFFSLLRSGEFQIEIGSFKMVPTSSDSVRASMQVKCVELVQYPDELGVQLAVPGKSDTNKEAERGEQ